MAIQNILYLSPEHHFTEFSIFNKRNSWFGTPAQVATFTNDVRSPRLSFLSFPPPLLLCTCCVVSHLQCSIAMSRSKLAKEYILCAQGGKNGLHKMQHVDNHKCFC